MSEHKINGWIKVPIENILERQDSGVTLGQGWSPQCLKTPSPSEEVWGVLKTTAIQAGYFLENENKELPETLQPRPQHEVKPGDLLITCAGPRNRCGVSCLVRKTRKRLMISGKMYRFRVSQDQAVPEFIEAYLQSQDAQRSLDKMKTGGSDSGLNLTHARFKKLLIPLPSVAEQRKIVSKLEELFSEIDKSIEDLKSAQQQLKLYRKSVLKWAFDGRLTNEVKEGELPDEWKWIKLLEVAKDITDGDHQPPPKTSTGVPFITISNVDKTSYRIDFYETFKVSEEYYLNLKSNRKPNKGDILYTVTGSFGIPILIDFEKEFCFQRHIGLIRPLDYINQKWLYFLLQSPDVFRQAESTATGTAQKTVALKSLRNFSIPFSPIQEQAKIVQEIESRLSVADKAEETIVNNLERAEALRQSILKKAFEGKL